MTGFLRNWWRERDFRKGLLQGLRKHLETERGAISVAAYLIAVESKKLGWLTWVLVVLTLALSILTWVLVRRT